MLDRGLGTEAQRAGQVGSTSSQGACLCVCAHTIGHKQKRTCSQVLWKPMWSSMWFSVSEDNSDWKALVQGELRFMDENSEPFVLIPVSACAGEATRNVPSLPG